MSEVKQWVKDFLPKLLVFRRVYWNMYEIKPNEVYASSSKVA